jgi:hypothetical protein
MGRPPGGPTCRAAIRPEPAGVEPALGGLELTDGVFTRPAEVTDGFVFHRWDLDAGEITGAPQAGPWPRVTTIGVDAVARLCGPESGRDALAHLALWRQIALEPVPTGARFISEDQGLGLGLKLAHELIKVNAPGPEVSLPFWKSLCLGCKKFTRTNPHNRWRKRVSAVLILKY